MTVARRVVATREQALARGIADPSGSLRILEQRHEQCSSWWIEMSDEAVAVQSLSIRVGLIRTGIGVAQSIALYLLFNAAQTKTWPFTNGALFSALVPVFLFAPPVAVLGLSDLRPRRLIGWTLTIAVIGVANLEGVMVLR